MKRTIATLLLGVAILVIGYRTGTVGGLAVMGIGALVTGLGLRMLFDLHGTAGPDANRPSEFIDGMPYDGYQTLRSLDPNHADWQDTTGH